MSESVICTERGATLLLRARTSKQRKLEVLAYSGGIMHNAGGVGGPVAVNLGRLRLPGRVPVNVDHNPDLRGMIGSGTPATDSRRLTVTVLLADNDAAREVISLLESDAPLQASVEVEIHGRTHYPEGETVELNGRTLTAPADGLTVITEGQLRAVAVVAAGADADTEVRLAASRGPAHSRRAITMSDTLDLRAKWASLTDEQRDDAGIVASFSYLAAGELTEERFDRIVASETSRRVRIDNRPRAGSSSAATCSPERARETLAAAFLLHCGHEHAAAKCFKPDTLQAARDLGIRHAMDLAAAACRLNPAMQGVPNDRGELLRAAMGPSTYSLPSALGLAGEKLMSDAYGASESSFRTWAGRKPVNNFRTQTAIRPHFTDGAFIKVQPSGNLKHGAAGEETYALKADTYGRILSIDRQDIINDDLGAFTELFSEMGRQAIRKVADVLYSALLDNAGSFFGSGNANFDDGSDSALSLTSLGAAVAMLRKQKDAGGRPIALVPRVILVPPELEATAASIVNSTTMSRDASVDELPTGNPWAGKLAVEVEPRLSDTAFHASASAKAWYLLAGPSTPCAVLAFLNGRDGPTVEQLPAPADQLGMILRGFIDFGVAMADHRAGFKSKGEA